MSLLGSLLRIALRGFVRGFMEERQRVHDTQLAVLLPGYIEWPCARCSVRRVSPPAALSVIANVGAVCRACLLPGEAHERVDLRMYDPLWGPTPMAES